MHIPGTLRPVPRLRSVGLLILLVLLTARAHTLFATDGAAPLDVVISEVAWGGSAASTSDEWIELYNPTGSAIDLTHWTLSDGGAIFVVLPGTIPAHGFYLLERSDDNTVSDVVADQIYTGALSNRGETLTLRDPTGVTIDTANGDGGAWPAGSGSPTFFSMERIDPSRPDSDANWTRNDGVTHNGVDADGNPLNGTPKARNSSWEPVQPPDLAVQKFGPAAVEPNSRAVYRLVLSNVGAAPAPSVRLTDTLPPGMVYAGDSSGIVPAIDGPEIAWNFDDLPPGASRLFTVTATVTATVSTGARGLLPNRVTATTTGPDPVPGDNRSTVTTTVVADVPAAIVINEILADPAGDANRDGVVDREDDEFVEIVNHTGVDVDMGGWLLLDRVGLRHVIPHPTIVPNGCGLVVFSGGEPAGDFGGMAVQTASTGGLSLNNSGDTVTLLDIDAAPVVTATYGSEAGQNQSITRVPDGVGGAAFVQHSRAPGAEGRTFSPGRRVDGHTFSGCPPSLPELTADAPHRVEPGAPVTYTLTLHNGAGFTLHNVVVSDTVPADAPFVAALDGGEEIGGTVRWTRPQLAEGASWRVGYVVTAPLTSTTLYNDGYAATATNLDGMVVGRQVATFVDRVTRIRHIQGFGHVSPLAGQPVTDVTGIVTAIVTRGSRGFFLQDPQPDGDDATSEALFVRTGRDPGVSVGDAVRVSGVVVERQTAAGALTVTEIHTPTVAVQSSLNALPPPVTIGCGGRTPPNRVIDDDRLRAFDPMTDGIDFYESLEGMRVELCDPVTVAPTTGDGLLPVVVDRGADASPLASTGALVIRPGDFNPERILLDSRFVSLPDMAAGVPISGTIEGIVGYRDANYQVWPTAPLQASSAATETTPIGPPAEEELSVATLNVENLDPGDPAQKFAGLAREIVTDLQAPDLIGLVEVQDNNGPIDDAVVDASETYTRLIQAIQNAGGPLYTYRQIDPVDDADAGQPGGNIRVAFLLRTGRGLLFVDRPGGDAITATQAIVEGDAVHLTLSPGRIDPTNGAFRTSRKPLAGEFTFDGTPFFAIVAHLNAKGADDPLFGAQQPPVFSSGAKRSQQAQVIADFVDSILALDANANVIVMGDLNDYPFSGPVRILAGNALTDLVDSLPAKERFSFIFQGNAQALDHILVSRSLVRNAALDFRIVHANTLFPDAPTDHDPTLARIMFLSQRLFLPRVVK